MARLPRINWDTAPGRAWLSAGAPILLLVLVVTALAFFIVLSFARTQDAGFARDSRLLIDSALQERMRAVENQAWDYAAWDEAYEAITQSWDQDWIDNNYFSSITDGVVIFRLDERGARNVWLGEAYTEQADAITAALLPVARDAIRSTPTRPADERGVVSGYVRIGDAFAAFALAPVQATGGGQPENGAISDYTAMVEIFDAEELAEIGAARNLEHLAFVPGESGPNDDLITLPLQAPNGDALGQVSWTNERPGSAAFLGQMWPIVLTLFIIGAFTVVVTRRLVAAQIAAAARAEAALESSRMRSEFIAAMSHELRTPLNSIIGYSELIKEEAEVHGAHDVIEHDANNVLNAAKQLLQLVNDVIDHSRLDAGRLQFTIENLPVQAVLSELEEYAAPLARAAGVTLTITDAAAGRRVQGDEVRVDQCLSNLVSNAIKYTPAQGMVSVSTRIERRGESEFIVFDVADTGIGMPETLVKQLFQPFAQLHAGVEKHAGAGLGLSITHKLVKAMGGDISVTSEQGKGSLFSLALPAAPANLADRAAGESKQVPLYA